MKKILFVYPWEGLSDSKSGASIRALYNLSLLAKKNSVDLLIYSSENIYVYNLNKQYKFIKNGTFIENPYEDKIKRHNRFIKYMFTSWLREGYSSELCYLDQVNGLPKKYDVIYLNYAFQVDLFRNFYRDSQIIVDTHDIFLLDNDAVRAVEIENLNKSDIVICCSKKDYRVCISLGLNPELLMHPIGLRGRNFPSNNSNKLRAIFVGSGLVWNVICAKQIHEMAHFFQESIDFEIIGSCGNGLLDQINVKVRENLSQHELDLAYKNSDVFINFISGGSGSSYKILEALSYSLIVLSSEIGFRGYEDNIQRIVFKVETLHELKKILKILSSKAEIVQKFKTSNFNKLSMDPLFNLDLYKNKFNKIVSQS